MEFTANCKLNFGGNNRSSYYTPLHELANSCAFGMDNELSETIAISEANFADAMARVAELNGLSKNDVMHLLPPMLRMLKSTSNWTK